MTSIAERLTTYDDPWMAARMYAQAMGWRVIPYSGRLKKPLGYAWQQRATTDLDQIDAWKTDFQRHGVCIVTGKESNLHVVDVDVADGKQGMDTLRSLLAARGLERVKETYTVRTPSGGVHFYLQYPKGIELGNDHHGKILGLHIDIKAEGGQVLAPPTPGYRWIDGRSPWELDIDEMPGGLW